MAHPPVTGDSVFRAVWPVVDDTYSRDELIAEAKLDLTALAAEADVIITGPATWDTTHTGPEVPEWEDWPGFVLIAWAPARACNTPEPVDPGARPAFVDWVVIERTLADEPTRELTKPEKKAAVRAGVHRGMSFNELAHCLGIAWTTVRSYAKADPAGWTAAA